MTLLFSVCGYVQPAGATRSPDPLFGQSRQDTESSEERSGLHYKRVARSEPRLAVEQQSSHGVLGVASSVMEQNKVRPWLSH